MSAYFITATGTDIGKTFFSSFITRVLHRRGYNVAAYKPILSGMDQDAPFTNDSGELLRAMGRPLEAAELEAITPWHFTAPLSPHRAAALEARSIEPAALEDWCRATLSKQDTDVTLIEGVGGILVPITLHYTVLDWMRALDIPVLLVVGDYLGTLSHSLSALHCLHHAGIKLHAIIVNESEASVEHEQVAPTLNALNPYGNTIPIGSLRRAASAASREEEKATADALMDEELSHILANLC